MRCTRCDDGTLSDPAAKPAAGKPFPVAPVERCQAFKVSVFAPNHVPYKPIAGWSRYTATSVYRLPRTVVSPRHCIARGSTHAVLPVQVVLDMLLHL